VLQRAYVHAYGVNLEEAAPAPDAYRCFDALFTRRLREGARQIDDDDVVSPADGSIQASGPIDSGARLFVKGRPYEVGELVGDPRDSSLYAEGAFAVVYLSPRDYHRVHSPVDGQITTVRGVPGDLFPVNAIGERHVSRLFVRNNRVAIVIKTPTLGRVTVVMVGAVMVGRICVVAIPANDTPPGTHPLDPPLAVKRGDEIGVFHLGSTAVLLVQPGVQISRPAGPVRYGQSLSKAP
jgi:phosphatidylserine decarboxylase